jgi:hypothetical protein
MQEVQRSGVHEQPGRHYHLGTQSGQEHPVGDLRHPRERGDHGEKGEAGLDWAEPEYLLQVVGEEQEDPEQPHAGEQHGQDRTSPGPVPYDPRRQQRVPRPGFEHCEAGQQDHPDDQEANGEGVVPGGGLGVREAVDQAEQAAGDQDKPGNVQRITVGGPVVLQPEHGAGRGDSGKDQVDVESPAP